ncbi:hypothetical protein M407DRAFT_35174 [Tulasnella calospora MUT 4182]|uniref:Uncharacterized protein n=1 Tax=Tulasnella calospora MUT 4182 TaxID=1051891 RepID=A0A0C3PLW0_9AGAM|nr:hypothetical protein M407DRAFT_35174 [Tulasnella calospora MUT 4182]
MTRVIVKPPTAWCKCGVTSVIDRFDQEEMEATRVHTHLRGFELGKVPRG